MQNRGPISEQSLLDRIRELGVVRITAHWGDTSAQYLDPDTGAPAGIVGSVGNLLARDLGVRAEYIDLPWAEHIPVLLRGGADVSVKHTNTPGRAFEVEFTVLSILCEDGRIVVRRDRGLVGESDLNQADRVISVAEGASQEIHLQTRFPFAQVLRFPTAQEALDAVAEGKTDGSLHDTKVPGFLLQHPECTVLDDEAGRPVTAYVDCVHPCIKPGDQRFLNWLNSWMAFHKASGTFERLVEQAEREHLAKRDKIIAMVRDAE